MTGTSLAPGITTLVSVLSAIKEHLPLAERLWGTMSLRMVPKAAKGTVGFGVAIYTESSEHKTKLASDFTSEIRKLLTSDKLPYKFSFIEFPQHHACRIVDSDTASKYMDRSKCKFLIYGKARLRNLNKEQIHVLNLSYIVSVQVKDQKQAVGVGEELSGLFLSEIVVPTNNDFRQFEVEAKNINIVSRFAIAVAAYASGDFTYAQHLMESLTRLFSRGTKTRELMAIREKLPKYLESVYSILALREHHEWRRNRSVEALDRGKAFVDKMEMISQNSYHAKLYRAIWFFVRNRDVKSALRELGDCKNSGDVGWLLSQAFLYAYQGKLADAVRTYRRAFKADINTAQLIEIEEFIYWVVTTDEGKNQLYMCLGLINLFGKNDRNAAAKDFESFLSKVHVDKYRAERTIAQSYLDDLRSNCEDIVWKVIKDNKSKGRRGRASNYASTAKAA